MSNIYFTNIPNYSECIMVYWDVFGRCHGVIFMSGCGLHIQVFICERKTIWAEHGPKSDELSL